MIKRRDLPFARNPCSYGGIGLNTDHKLVTAELQIEWFMKISKRTEGINIENLKDQRNQVKYQEQIQETLEEKEKDPGKIWKILERHVQK